MPPGTRWHTEWDEVFAAQMFADDGVEDRVLGVAGLIRAMGCRSAWLRGVRCSRSVTVSPGAMRWLAEEAASARVPAATMA